MDDDDLKRIREERLRQLKQQAGNGGGGGGGGGSSEEQRQKQQQQQTNGCTDNHKGRNLLNQILEPDAADRLARIRLVKEERASAVEDRLLMLAQSGQLRGKVSEDQLKDMLTRLSAAEDAKRGTSSSAGRIVVDRRTKGGFDDDDLDLDI
ncbi:programmed cell death protein 5 [Sporothrix schenckii 1099-18]|uniref:Programmed cell death protein 5 n=1 Tax=Sporothrix schenckii 1099-18 TaxID=1397361 RepID=A0A0F2M702_SPOSC|nr:programmed cell death protein 5 [Sporothrix schenckii 1099-18]KJR85478.1 programmed cell death protein 5 [Sporothrix schenckii 1099-18]